VLELYSLLVIIEQLLERVKHEVVGE